MIRMEDEPMRNGSRKNGWIVILCTYWGLTPKSPLDFVGSRKTKKSGSAFALPEVCRFATPNSLEVQRGTDVEEIHVVIFCGWG